MDNKRTIFNSYTDFNNLPKVTKDIIDMLKVTGVATTDTPDIFLNSVILSKIISIGEFPSVENQPIPKITLFLSVSQGVGEIGRHVDSLRPLGLRFKH